MAEPPNARHCLVHRVVMRTAFAEDRMRQDRPGITVFDDQDSQGRLAAVLSEEAIVHCNLRH
eukprot:2960274-Alexandrium_andersonii.AAC.1